MSTTMESATPRAARRLRPLLFRVTMFVLCWTVAAGVATSVHRLLDVSSPVAAGIMQVTAILLTSLAYTRLTRATLDHALLTGLAWVVIAMGAELFVSSTTGHAWFGILGSPSRPALRDLLIFSWIAGPAAFGRYW